MNTMFQLPPYPGWEGLHPLVIHFPVALLLVAPVLLILGLIVRQQTRAFMLAGFVLMLLGTLGALAAVKTGEAAGELAERTPEISAVLERHESLAETTLTIFAILTFMYAALLFVPGFFKRVLSRKIIIWSHLIFLAVYASGSLVLVNTAHHGGRLVHEFGVQSIVGGETNSSETQKE